MLTDDSHFCFGGQEARMLRLLIAGLVCFVYYYEYERPMLSQAFCGSQKSYLLGSREPEIFKSNRSVNQISYNVRLSIKSVALRAGRLIAWWGMRVILCLETGWFIIAHPHHQSLESAPSLPWNQWHSQSGVRGVRVPPGNKFSRHILPAVGTLKGIRQMKRKRKK